MTDERELRIVVEHDLAEEAVLRALRGRPEEREFRRARDPLYSIADPDARERAFRDFHLSWFERLGLGDALRAALDSIPVLAERCRRCVVATAPAASDEGADLLVAGGAHDADRTVLLRLRATTLLDRDALRALLRGELLHVADMLDPVFGYTPDLPSGEEPMRGRLLRERYRVLWNVRIAGRLWREGGAPHSLRDAACRSFAAMFPMLGSGTESEFRRFFDGAARTHRELLAFAAAPRAGAETRGLISGAACPLCRFATYLPEPCPERLPDEALERIAAEFPGWTPARGLCRQCADLYRSRALSLAAAARLPG